MNIPPTHFYPKSTPAPNGAPVSVDRSPRQTVLVDDGNVKIQHLSTFEPDQQGKPVMAVSRVLITTTNRSDTVKISVGTDNQLIATINGKSYKLPLSADNPQHSLRIRAEGGNDLITVDKRANIELHIEGGDGNDTILADGNTNTVDGGKGDDYIRLGKGYTVAHGGDGNDIILAGTGSAMISGGKGDDKLYAMTPKPGTSLRQVFLNGDEGNDELYAGSGKSILNGGLGDDKLVGYRDTTIYTGAGKDRVISHDAEDRIYAKKTDTVQSNNPATTTYINYSEAGKKGFTIKGPPKFVEQVENHMEQLRGSPAGLKMLEEMDKLAEKNGSPVTILPSTLIATNSYTFRNQFRDNLSDSDYHAHKYSPELGYIKNGVTGSVATHAEIAFAPDYFEKTFSLSPLLALYHEMSHAYNGATGTFIPGARSIMGEDGAPLIKNGEPVIVENHEYQAVGLPSNGTPFDFDNNPKTAPTTTNPTPFTENALRKEMGLPLRDRYEPNEPSRLVSQ